MNTSLKEYRELDRAELRQKVDKLQEQYRAARETVRLGKEKNHASLKYLKRDIARAKTVLNTKENK